MDSYIKKLLGKVTTPKPITGLTELNIKLVDITFCAMDSYLIANDWVLFDTLVHPGEPLDWYKEQYQIFFNEYFEHVLVKAIDLIPSVTFDEASLEIHIWKLNRRVHQILSGQDIYRGRLEALAYGEETKKAVFLKFICAIDTNHVLRFSSVVKAAVINRDGDLIDAGEIERFAL